MGDIIQQLCDRLANDFYNAHEKAFKEALQAQAPLSYWILKHLGTRKIFVKLLKIRIEQRNLFIPMKKEYRLFVRKKEIGRWSIQYDVQVL